MSLRAKITQINTTNDGVTNFGFTIFDDDDPDRILDTHSQGIYAIPERKPVKSTRTVVDYDETGLATGSHEETFEDWVETGRMLPPPPELIEEAIQNYVRDVFPLRKLTPRLSVGHTFEV